MKSKEITPKEIMCVGRRSITRSLLNMRWNLLLCNFFMGIFNTQQTLQIKCVCLLIYSSVLEA